MSIRPDLIDASPHVASLEAFRSQGMTNALERALRLFQERYHLDAVWSGVLNWRVVWQRDDGKTELEATRWRESMWTVVTAELVGVGEPLGRIRLKIPRMTERASFIVDGLERAPMAQLVPLPGVHLRVYERHDGTKVWEASIRPSFGRAVTVSYEQDPQVGTEKWTLQVGAWQGWPADFAEQLGWAPDPFRAYARGAAHGRHPAARRIPKDLLIYLEDQAGEAVKRRFSGVLTITKSAESPPHSLEPFHVLGLIGLVEAARQGTGPEQGDPEDLATQRVSLVGDHLQQAAWKAAWEWRRWLDEKIQQARSEGKQGLEGSPDDWMKGLEARMQRHIDRYLKGPLCQPLDRTNPLAELSHKRKITRYGAGGLPKEYRGLAYRDVHPSHYGRLCPVETPESLELGLTLHLATYARVRDHQLEAPFYETGGLGGPSGSEPIWLGPANERRAWSRVADGPEQPKLVRSSSGTQELAEETDGHQVAYEDACPGLGLGLAASLIPFIQHNDVNRALMGAKNLKQALPLNHPEVPLVQTGFERIVGRLAGRWIGAVCEGKVEQVRETPIVRNGQVVREAGVVVGGTEHPMPESTEGRLGSRLSYRPVVRVGQEVRRGDVLAEGPAMVGETLALGVNLLVAYLPWYGYNFEDGIVISDRLVREDVLTSLHEYRIEEEFDPAIEVTGIASYGGATPPELGEDGVIRRRERVREGTVLARLWRRAKGDRHAVVITHRTEVGGDCQYIVDAEPRDVVVQSGVCGTVEDVELTQIHGRRRRLRVIIREERRVTVGDKLMGRHGNKGVITRIVPEAAMPSLEDGTPVDILLNPLGVVGRLNLGQLLETHVGLVARRKAEPGRTYHPFQRLDLDRLRNELAEVGYPDGKARLRDGWSGQHYEASVVVGYQYFVKLNHLAEDKEQARDTGPYAPITQQAVHGRVRHGGQRVGEMEMWALLAHQAEDTLAELFGPRADDLKARAALHGLDLSDRWKKTLLDFQRTIPESFRVMECYLRALGLSVVPNLKPGSRIARGRALRPSELESLTIQLAPDEEIKRWGLPVEAAPWHTQRVWGTLSCRCEGYHDEILICRRPYLCRTHPSEVTLTCDCKTNPVGMSDKVLKASAQGKLVCTKCGCRAKKIEVTKGQIRSLGLFRRELGYAKGGLFCEQIFGPAQAVRLVPCGCRGRYEDLVKEVQTRKGTTRQCTKHSRHIRAVVPDEELRRTTWGVIPLAEPVEHPLTRARQRATNPPGYSYSAQLDYIPVLPPVLRPHGQGSRAGAELNWLYERIVRVNNRVRRLKDQETGSPAESADLKKAKDKLQRFVDELMVDGAVARSGRRYRSVLEHLRGKWGTVRHDLLGRRVDASGRAVIVGAPWLAPDQVALPKPMIETLFGLDLPKAAALMRRADARVLLVRQPSLHRYNVLALRPMPWDHPVIGLPPLITPGFNADFDGDTMACFLPVLARSEAGRLTPERHLRSVASGDWMLATGHELAAGVYVATEHGLPALLDAAGGTGMAWKDAALRQFVIQQWEKDPRHAMWLAQSLAALAFGAATKAGLSLSHFDLAPIALLRSDRLTPTRFEDWKKKVRGRASALAARHPVRIYLDAGTKLKDETLTQLAGGRGEFPRLRPLPGASHTLVTSNLYEGMHPLEFFASAHGSRSSLGDKKLGVAQTGTFTRQLVHGAFDLRIVKKSCSSHEGVWLTDLLAIPDEKDRAPGRSTQLRIAVPLWKRLIGRVAIANVASTSISRGRVIGEQQAPEVNNRIFAVQVRSPLTCQAGPGKICAACYGWDRSTGQMPEDGLWVGIVAGQSIGERATQLTFRTFHTGGAGGGATVQGFGRARALFQGQELDVPVVEAVGSSTGEDLYTVIRRWDQDQVAQPNVRQATPEVKWEADPKDAGSAVTSKIPAIMLTSWPDTLSRTHLEFRAIYGHMVHEIHAEVILRALRDANVVSIRLAARRPNDPLGALAFGHWQAVRGMLREGRPVTLPLNTPRSRVLLGWPGDDEWTV